RLQMLELANAATMKTEPLTDKVLGRMDDLRPTFRYYAALGILVRGKSAVEEHAAKLEKAMRDSEVSVRITAAEALGRYGNEDQKAEAIGQLLSDANLENTSPAASVWALNSLQAIGADGLKDEISKLPAKDGLKRGGGYVTRLIRDLTN
ncbi:MAG: HEAT repeat domain-containing protein, partial [Planctomycetota bacterium]